MEIYGFKNGISIFNKELKEKVNEETEFFTFQIFFDRNIDKIKEDDYQKFILIHVEIEAIQSDAMIRKVKVILNREENPTQEQSLYKLNFNSEKCKAYLIYQNGQGDFERLFSDTGVDFENLNHAFINRNIPNSAENMERLNCSTSRFPSCPPQ